MEIAGAMTNVVSFQPRPSSPRAEGAGLDAPATIIIFPGVRYERAEADSHETQARRGGRRSILKGPEKAAP